MPTIPTYLVGRNCTLFGVAAATVDASGAVVTFAAATSFLGKFDSFEVQFSATTTPIKAANAVYENEVIISDTFSARVTEIIPPNGSSVLMAKYAVSDYFQVTTQCAPNSGAGTVGMLLTLVGIRKSCSYQIVEGKNVAVLELGPCGIAPVVA